MKIKDGITGLIIGDALGVPVEFTSREDLIETPVTRMEGYGTYNQPAGTWSDDSAMALATMHSIVQKNGIDYTDIMDKFVEWLFNAKYMQGNHTFDCGITTSNAIKNYKYNKYPPLECGLGGDRDNGNGSLMRILPLAFIKDIDYETIENVSALTHAHERSRIACVLYVEMAKSMIENEDLSMEEHINLACDKIKDYYKDLKAVNIGGDTDTNAAICGGLAGIYYGYDSIPIDWVNEIYRLDEVLSLCERYEVFCDES